jgi:hypothetical protein
MTQAHDAGPQIDGEPLELDDTIDATGDLDEDAEDESGQIVYSSDADYFADDDEQPFTPEDYEAVAAETAAEAEDEQTEVEHDAPPDDAEPRLDGVDPKLANHIQKLRREAADKRVALAEAEERLQAAGTEIAALQARLEDGQRRDVEAIALSERMYAPGELFLVADLPEMLDKHGNVDPGKVGKVIDAKVPEHWRVPVRHPGRHGFTSGATGMVDTRPTSWQEVVRGQQG